MLGVTNQPRPLGVDDPVERFQRNLPNQNREFVADLSDIKRANRTVLGPSALSPILSRMQKPARPSPQIRRNTLRRYIQKRISQSTKSTAAPWSKGS